MLDTAMHPRSLLLVLAALAAVAIAGTTADAADVSPPFSAAATKPILCAPSAEATSEPAAPCSSSDFETLTKDLDTAYKSALKTTSGLALMLLKRDQAWFAEILAAHDPATFAEADEIKAHAATARALLSARTAALKSIATAAKSPNLGGRWVNTFAAIEIDKTADGSITANFEAKPVSAPFEGRERCAFRASLKFGEDHWLAGAVQVIRDDGSAEDIPLPYEGATPRALRVTRHGETLRVVDIGNEECGALTGTYFHASAPSTTQQPSTPSNASTSRPTFTCETPSSATEEEICADPELAAADHRINTAWTTILAKLDKKTQGALKEDQRAFNRALANFYVYHLHPFWNKETYFHYYLDDARDAVLKLMHERIAILENLEPSRKEWSGLWVAHDAKAEATIDAKGKRTLVGGKWEYGDYKSYCEYQMSVDKDGSGRTLDVDTASDLFKEYASKPNGLKVVADGATLVISGKPVPNDGTICRRNLDPANRLFPVKPLPNLGLENPMR